MWFIISLIAITLFLFVLTFVGFSKNSKKKANNLKMISEIDFWYKQIEYCGNLYSLLELHKALWSKGIQCRNLDVCLYGIFRANSIEEMKPDNVYLGGVHGLFTHNIPFWHNCDDEEAKKIVIHQYKNILLSNLTELKSNIEQ